MTDPLDMGAWAVAYVGVGWSVFPVWGLRLNGERWVCRCPAGPGCEHPGKHPVGRFAPNGFKDATLDVALVDDWWDRDRSMNIGLNTGSEFDVLDVDHDDFTEGVADLPECETAGGPVVRTGRGRMHLYFAATGVGRKIKFSEHCDWLGEGGYVIAPPSRHVCGGHYEWFGDTGPWTPLLEPPRQLFEVLDPPPRPYSVPDRPLSALAKARGNGGRAVRTARGWSAVGLFGKMATAVEGERNSVLHWCACKIGEDVAAGKVDENQALAALGQLVGVARRTGLDDREIKATIRSGYRP